MIKLWCKSTRHVVVGVVVNDRAIGDGNGDGISGSSSGMDGRTFITADVRQPWTNPQDCYFEYLIIRFDYLIIHFDYLIIG